MVEPKTSIAKLPFYQPPRHKVQEKPSVITEAYQGLRGGSLKRCARIQHPKPGEKPAQYNNKNYNLKNIMKNTDSS